MVMIKILMVMIKMEIRCIKIKIDMAMDTLFFPVELSKAHFCSNLGHTQKGKGTIVGNGMSVGESPSSVIGAESTM